MNELDRIMTEIHVKLAKYREAGYGIPTHLALDIGAKQALKMTAHPFADPPLPNVETYLGIQIIDLEKILIVDSQSLASKAKGDST